MKSYDIRNKFIKYFSGHQHEVVSSSRLVPDNDPTLLFNNAGMNQFKNVFLGLESRDYKRAVSAQKCVRAGGKHNDLENVGHTARHHTFFEMLGNFSFGDYFKKEAIHFSWDFVTRELGMDKDRLYVSVYEKDDEAAEIWHKQEGLPFERIYRFGEKDNFWRMGETGPCGPCSEIFYDLGPEVGGRPEDNVMGGEGDRFIEFWNLVFMQFFEDELGHQVPLPNPSIDTGLGLERLTAILQGEISNYHTDLFMPLINKASQLSGVEYVKNLKGLRSQDSKEIETTNTALRVVADHARASAFLIADGVLPSNEGRGYVLRRILRRGIRFGRKLSSTQSLLPSVVETVIEQMQDFYPELKTQKSLILNHTRDEETRFLTTLDQGTQILDEALHKLDALKIKTLDGELAFKLYDTYGFPLDLTRLMAKERGFSVHEAEFEHHMDKAREKAKASWKGKALSGDAAYLLKTSQELLHAHGPTEFTGHAHTQWPPSTSSTTKSQQTDPSYTKAKVLLVSDGQKTVTGLNAGQNGFLVLDKTCFYAESGGQVGDKGLIESPQASIEVLDCQKHNDIHVHFIKVLKGEIKVGDSAHLKVQESTRRQTACNHSATHLLHSALREVLGTHITQAGSLVEPHRLRFDFTHNKPLSLQELNKIEQRVNQEIAKALPVTTQIMSPQAAQEAGALALFGEKYGDQVRVVQMGDSSIELCGGTHVPNTSVIRLFKIVSEAGVSSGVRRLEALTGERAFAYLNYLATEDLRAREKAGITEAWNQIIDKNTDPASVNNALLLSWMQKKEEEIKALHKEVQNLKKDQVSVDSLLQQKQVIQVKGQSISLLTTEVPVDDRQVLSRLVDQLRDRLGSGVIILAGQGEGSFPLFVALTKDLVGPLHAGQILKNLANELGGKGGGRPDFAQGAVPTLKNLPKIAQNTILC